MVNFIQRRQRMQPITDREILSDLGKTIAALPKRWSNISRGKIVVGLVQSAILEDELKRFPPKSPKPPVFKWAKWSKDFAEHLIISIGRAAGYRTFYNPDRELGGLSRRLLWLINGQYCEVICHDNILYVNTHPYEIQDPRLISRLKNMTEADLVITSESRSKLNLTLNPRLAAMIQNSGIRQAANNAKRRAKRRATLAKKKKRSR